VRCSVEVSSRQVTFPSLRSAWRCLGAGACFLAVLFVGEVSGQVFDARVQEALRRPAPEVLIINSYAPGYQWSDDMFDGVTRELKETYKDIEPVIHYLDARRFPEPEREAWLLQDIQHKVARRPPRLVITLDDAAFNFALQHREAIAPGVPLVFGGVNRFVPEMIAGRRGITGVSEETDFSGTFQLIRRLRPQARQVLVLSNRSPSAIASRRAFEAFAPRYEDRYTFEYFDEWTNDELFARLSRLDSQWVALILDVTRDAAGEDNYNSTRFYERMRREPAVPVFINSRPPGARNVEIEPWDTIGGGLVVADVHGEAVGRIAVRVLAGEPADSISVVPYSPQQLQVEYTQMKRFNLPLEVLPPGTLINNQPPNTVAIDRARLLQAIVVFVALCVVITFLLINIVSRRRAERALRRAEEHLRSSQKLEAVGLLAGGVAHDFNNLLQVIRGHSGFLRDALESTRPQELEDVRAIEEAAERAAQLTRQLLAFGRKQALNFGVIDPNAMVEDMVKMLRRLLGEHIELSVRLLPEPCPLVADRGQLEQVIVNLCLNARDAIQSSGRIQIELKRVTIDVTERGELSELKPGPYLELMVSDNGSGMSAEVKRRIFEPFFTTKRLDRGSGLGLAVVHGIVHQHAGVIRVYSEEGKGSAFRVLLPIRSVTEGHTVRPAAPAKRVAKGSGAVLLAEDDRQVRDVAERVLRRNGFKVLTAADGREALEVFTQHRDEIRILILDVLMPKLNGRQVYDQVREKAPALPVLFCSGYSAEMLPAEMTLGQDSFLLNKPYTDHELLTRVHQLLRS
jgi:signal transduction histidine kinase